MSQHNFWKGRRVLVTGGNGFLGSFVVERLKGEGCDPFVAEVPEFDLRREESIVRAFRLAQPQVVIHLAAVVGGIGANRKYPGRFFYDNAIMGIQMIEQARRSGIEKFLAVGTVCAYPKFAPIPFREDSIWNGYPEETNAPYGLAKKMLLVQLQAYRQQYNFPGVYLLPVNLYGPNDKFDLEDSHVIPALLRKFHEAKADGKPSVTVWGSGSATREFLYVRDAAEGIVRAGERYSGSEPVNLGSGQEISIRDLVLLIKDLMGYSGEVVWDSSKPDGQPRRCLDTSRALAEFGWKASTPFRQGMQETVEWFLSNYSSIIAREK